MSADTHTEVPRATPKITERMVEDIEWITQNRIALSAGRVDPASLHALSNIARSLASRESVLVPAAEIRELREYLASGFLTQSKPIATLDGWLRGDTP